jgi:hypothetical protein
MNQQCCRYCYYCKGKPKSQMQVVLASIANLVPAFFCTDCPDLNDTYLLDIENWDDAEHIKHACPPNFCSWRYDFDPEVCNVVYLTAHFSNETEEALIPNDHPFYLHVYLMMDAGLVGTPPIPLAHWACWYDERPRCDAPSGQALSLIFVSGSLNIECDVTAATCTITALNP